MKAKNERNNETPSCAAVAPLLTALFDGEADAQATQSARAHLLSCERCARTWLDWNQHRAILRNESVPAPPPTLLWRVLLACRLANLTRGKAARTTQHQAQKASLFPDATLPGDLNARILAQTTRQQKPVANLNVSRSAGRRFPVISWPTFAMPALAAWIILLGQGTWFAPVEAPRVDETEVPLVASARQSRPAPVVQAKSVAKVTPARSVKNAAPRAIAPPQAEATSVQPNLKPFADSKVLRRAAMNASKTATAVRSTVKPTIERYEARVESRPVHSRFTTVEATTQEPRPVRKIRAIAPLQASVPVVEVTYRAPAHRFAETVVAAVAPVRAALAQTRTLAVRPTVTRVRIASVQTHLRTAALSDEIETPRPRVARPMLAHFSPDERTTLRSSRPASVLTLGPTRFAALDTFDAEEHVEDVQSAVNDFRSAFSSDEENDSFEGGAG